MDYGIGMCGVCGGEVPVDRNGQLVKHLTGGDHCAGGGSYPKNVRPGGNRWRVTVEFTFDILPEDLGYLVGDTALDQAERAFARRLRPTLADLPVKHWTVIKTPDSCVELD